MRRMSGRVWAVAVVAVLTSLPVGALPAGAATMHAKVPPAAPIGVVAAAGRTSSLVSWPAVTPPAGETITKYLAVASATSAATEQCKASLGTTSCTIPKLTYGIPYTIRVQAFVGRLAGPASAPVTMEPGLAGAPTTVLATVGNHRSIVSFTEPVTNGIRVTSYKVTATDATTAGNGGQTATGHSTSITVTRLTIGDTYTFTVVAIDKLGPGPASAPSAPVVPSMELTATGSSFASVAIQQWVGQSSTLYGLNIDWQVSSSVIGLNDFAQDQVDFAASDFPYSASQSTYYPEQPYQYVPDVAGGLSFMYNLIGSDGKQITNLNLDASVIGEIFLGEITYWNDPRIEAINPQLSGDLPHTTVFPVYRADASGDNYLLSDYLLHLDDADFTAAEAAFQTPIAGQPTATWPTPGPDAQPSKVTYPEWGAGVLQGENGPDSAADYVASASSDGAITYVQTAYANVHDFPVANVLNASGNYVQPTSLNVSTALEAAAFNADWSQNLGAVYTNPQTNAYPVSSYSYLVTPCSPTLAAGQGSDCDGPATSSPFKSAKGAALGQFIDFMACAGQETMSSLGYAPLPPALVEADFAAIGRMNGGVQPPAPTAANCANPYIDGQVTIPGG